MPPFLMIFGKLWIFLKWFYVAIFPSWLSGLILYLYKSKAWPRAMQVMITVHILNAFSHVSE